MKNLRDEKSRNDDAQNVSSQNKNLRKENPRNEIDQKENQNSQNKKPEKNTNNPSKNFKMNGNWSDQSKGLKSKYSQLTDEDLKVEPGKEDEMIERMQTRLNKNREEVINIIQQGQRKLA